MPYADKSKYVLASKAIPEIARCYFDGDTDKAADDALLAAQDGELRIYSDESVWGETTPFNHIDKDVWYRSSIHWSGRRRLYLRRADLLKIYPDLWKPATSAVPPEPAIEDRGDDDNAAAPQETAPTPQENDERPEYTPPSDRAVESDEAPELPDTITDGVNSKVEGKAKAKRAYSKAKARRWYTKRKKEWPPDQKPPSRKEDIRAAKNECDEAVTYRFISKLRNELAPEWTAKGRPSS